MGSGHVMRCLTLANKLRSRGAEITFITRHHPGCMVDDIEKERHKVILLSVPNAIYQERSDDVGHASWLGVSWEQDAEETSLAIGDSRPDWLIVDHYGIDARWHLELRNQVGQIMAIDDLADRTLDCDMLLDQAYGRQEDDYWQRVPSNCQMFLGSRYALLRPEFSKLRAIAIEKRKAFNGVNRILVSMGGMDPDNVTAIVLKGLSGVDWKRNPTIDVVLGGNAPHLEEIVVFAKKSALDILVSTDVTDMADRMLTADLAIGAGGATSWERCCMGLPSLTTVISENQLEIVRQLQNQGSIQSLGHSDRLTSVKVKDAVSKTLLSNDILMEMSRKGFDVTDGEGAYRVFEVMYEPH